MRVLTLAITEELAGRTVKSVLRRELKLSMPLIARVKRRENGICLNGRRVFITATVRAGDLLAVDVEDTAPGGHFTPMPVPLEILWEDADLLVLNKPAAMAVHHSGEISENCTVANALAHYLGPSAVFHAVSRLDRGTTGVMAVAKSGYVHDRLRRELHTGSYHRDYLAVAVGRVTPASGAIELPIGREEGHSSRRVIAPDGVYARTDYETVSVHGALTLLRVLPQTGRSHQIRLHLAAIGHPLVGDWLYGKADPALIGRPALHSSVLRLKHPVTGEALCITAPLPADMRALVS